MASTDQGAARDKKKLKGFRKEKHKGVARAGAASQGVPLTTHRLQEAVFSRRDPMQPQEGEQDMRMPTAIRRMAVQPGRPSAASGRGSQSELVPLSRVPGVGWGAPELSSSPGEGLSNVARKGYREQYCPPTGEHQGPRTVWPLI